MESLLEKISSYNILNNLIPGAVFVFLGKLLDRPYKNRASGARCAGKSLRGQGNLSAKTLRLRPLRPSPGAG